MGEIVGRLIAVLLNKGILTINDMAFIMGEKFCNQAALTMYLVKNGIFSEEDLKKAMDEEDGKH